jgi:hypothetical protein
MLRRAQESSSHIPTLWMNSMATGLLAAALLILLQAQPAPAEQAARQLIEEAIRLEKTPGLVLLTG